jgi:serine/tyrosine/threonine adenylyltransferase
MNLAASTDASSSGARSQAVDTGLAFVEGIERLSPVFYTRWQTEPLGAPRLVAASQAAASLIGLSPERLGEGPLTEALAGNRPILGSNPIAMVYSGHQFGQWAGQLGDGRALLLGTVRGANQSHWEIQLKGAGRTPYSRMGDGRAVLRSSIREFLCSEAMHHLGIATTRALAVVCTDDPVIRETVESAAVITRLAPSFVRFGSFEHFYSRKDERSLTELADFVIQAHYPHLVGREDRYQAFLAEVTARTAQLIAHWQTVGFCHGVMNTDNMSILGLTLDYGPFGFLDEFDPEHICNHSDHGGRYRYSMQPGIGQWNCYRLGQALVGLIGSVQATEDALAGYGAHYNAHFDRLLHAKLGLAETHPNDGELFESMFGLLAAQAVDFTAFFRRLSQIRQDTAEADAACRALFSNPAAFDAWADRYRERLRAQAQPDADRAAAMNRVNPKYVLRNHLAEIAIAKAQGGRAENLQQHAQPAVGRAAGPQVSPSPEADYSEVRRLLAILERPFDEQPEAEAYAEPAPAWASQLEISCSS